MRSKYYRYSCLLLLAALLGSTLGRAQSPPVVINDLTFVLRDGAGPSGNRSQLHDALQAFSERHALGVSLTTLLEDDPYQEAARQQEDQRLQQTAPVLVITAWYDKDTKARRRTQVQVNEAMASRLPQATAEQIITEALDYYRTNPLSDDALMQGMRLALHRLDAYLDGLPSAGEVPTITFANPSATDPPPLGLDQMRYPAHQGNYTQFKIKQTDYLVAWKALPSNQPTTVLAQVDKELSFPPGVVFRQNDNSVPSQPSNENHQQQLTLAGQAHRQEGEVLVYASAEEEAELVGQLNTISYDVLPKSLVLVSLDNTIPHDSPEMDQEIEAVVGIFAQAGVDLKVTTEEFNTNWGHRDTLLEDNTSGMLSNYPKQLKRVIKDYRRARGKASSETAYIFLAGGSTSGRKGYMPKKRNYGFVFVHEHTGREPLARTIAHELGHGWFRLEHSWQTYPALTEGSTNNLMDYGSGKTLHKYQWDLIHDPVGMLGWFQDEDDVSDYTKRTDVEWVVEMYGPYSSGQMIAAHKAGELTKVANWINRELKNHFDVDDLKAIGKLSKAIPRTRDGRIPVAILKHYPKAKHQEKLIVYYTEKNPQGGLRPTEKPLVFSPPYPVDLSLHTGEFEGTDEKAASMEEEAVKAFGNLAYDFVWQTMTEQSVADKFENYLKEVWDYPSVGKDEGGVRQLMEGIAKTAFGKSCTYPVEEKVIYMYDFALDGKKVPLALHILEDEPSFKRNDLVELDLSDSEDKPYILLAFCEGKNQSKAKVLVQVGEEYSEALKEYFSEGNVVQKEQTVTAGLVAPKKMLADASTAIEVAQKYTSTTACNICVRAALYLMKDDPALFPTSGSGYHNPTSKFISEEVKGYIAPEGRAIRIKEDFDNLAGKPKLNERFEWIEKGAEETYQAYFERLQDQADIGQIVIGVMLNSRGDEGHTVMITPGGLIKIDEKTTEEFPLSFLSRGIKDVLRVLECGGTLRETKGPLYLRVDGKGATKRMKWFKYLK